jgi:4-amino-4-deoxy-L-arabinose transferase-like glycosyltransferase
MVAGDKPTTPRPALFDRRRALIAAAIFLVSFVPATIWFLKLQPAPATDFKDFVDHALSIVDHHQFGYPQPSADRFPGYPFFLALLIWVKRSYLWIGFWNVGLTALIGVLTYYLALRLTDGDERTATIAGFASALNPTFIFFAPLFASEHLFVPLLLLSLLFVLATRPPPVVRALLSGLALGLAILTRGEALFYAPVVVLCVILTEQNRRRKATTSAWLVAACLVTVVPWYVRNVSLYGANVGLSTTGSLNFYFAHNDRAYGWRELDDTPLEGLEPVAAYREGYRLGLDYLLENPLRLFSDAATGTARLYAPGAAYGVREALWVPASNSAEGVAFRRKYPWGTRGLVATYYVCLALLAVASVLFFRSRRRAAWLVPLGIIAMNWLCYAVVFWAKARYRFTMEAFSCVLAGIALSEASRRPWMRSRPASKPKSRKRRGKKGR